MPPERLSCLACAGRRKQERPMEACSRRGFPKVPLATSRGSVRRGMGGRQEEHLKLVGNTETLRLTESVDTLTVQSSAA